MKIKDLQLKRALQSVLLVLLLSAGMTNVYADHYSVTIGDLRYNLYDNILTAEVRGHVDGTAATGSLVIPETVTYNGTDYSVTIIGDNAFSGCSGFTGSLTIPNSVTLIEVAAFRNCTGFDGNLTIGNSVTIIGDHAFTGCSGFIGSLTIPNSVTKIGGNAFYNCTGFTGSLTIGNSVTTIKSQAFFGCSGFTGSLTIPNSVTTIEGWAFYGCSGFSGSLTIGNSVTTIGQIAFHGCSGFTGTLTIGNSVNSIGFLAFNGCSGFTGSLTIPNSVTEIGHHAFCDCSGFTGSLTIPNSVTEIGQYAFSRCSGFTGSLTIPDSVTVIPECAFSNCSGFTGNLVIGNSVTEIGQSAFSGCSGFTGNLIIPDSVTTINGWAFKGCSGFTGSLTIGNSVTTIGEQAFRGCSGFNGNLTIGNSVNLIDLQAFYGCNGFMGNLTIGDSVTTIGYEAFCRCSGFTGNLTIPNSVTELGQNAFLNCSGFNGSLTIPNSITAIPEGIFYNCSGLSGIVMIPNSVTEIGNYAFSQCSNIDEMFMISSNPPLLGSYVFSLSSFPIYVPFESLNTYKTAENWSNYENRIFSMVCTSILGYGESTGNWHFIASPLVDDTDPTLVYNLITETDYDLYRFNQSVELEWENYKYPENTPDFFLTNGRGYLYANRDDVILVFKGAFINDDTKQVNLIYDSDAELPGWNLVGNPFPVNAYANKSYYRMNDDGSAIYPTAVSTSTAIAPCTGIMVKADNTGETVTFSTEAPEATTNQGNLQIAVAQVNTRGCAFQDKAIVSFNVGDQLEKFVFNKDNAQISIPQDGKEFAIACTEKLGEMPLNFRAVKNGDYAVSVNAENVEMAYLHLIDNMTSADVDLLAEPNYIFEAKTTDYASRFRLVFSANDASTNSTDDETFAFISNGNIIVNGEGVLQIVDVTGHVFVNTDAARHISTDGICVVSYQWR